VFKKNGVWRQLDSIFLEELPRSRLPFQIPIEENSDIDTLETETYRR
jgi:hypothetical protein